MRPGHKEAQDLFLDAGRQLGYEVRRTFTGAHPTDGVWLKPDLVLGESLPQVAIEVIVSEGNKSRMGSVAVLEAVSPALGIVLLHDEEIRRGLIRKGWKDASVSKEILLREKHLRELAEKSRQRIRLWRFGQLARLHRLTVGSPVRAA